MYRILNNVKESSNNFLASGVLTISFPFFVSSYSFASSELCCLIVAMSEVVGSRPVTRGVPLKISL